MSQRFIAQAPPRDLRWLGVLILLGGTAVGCDDGAVAPGADASTDLGGGADVVGTDVVASDDTPVVATDTPTPRDVPATPDVNATDVITADVPVGAFDVRVAHLSPGAPAVDFCVRPASATSWSGVTPTLRGATAGLVHPGHPLPLAPGGGVHGSARGAQQRQLRRRAGEPPRQHPADARGRRTRDGERGGCAGRHGRHGVSPEPHGRGRARGDGSAQDPLRARLAGHARGGPRHPGHGHDVHVALQQRGLPQRRGHELHQHHRDHQRPSPRASPAWTRRRACTRCRSTA